MRPHRSGRSFAVLGVAALVLTLLGAGCTNPFKKNPEETLRKATDQWIASESVRIDATLALDIAMTDPGKEAERGHVDVRITGVAGGNTVADQRADGTITLRADTPFGSGELVLNDRAIGQVAYHQLTEVSFTAKGTDAPPQATVDAMLGAVKGVIGGKWVRVDPQEIASLAQGLGGAAVELSKPEELQALADRMKEALRQHPILVFRQDLGKERVGKMKAYHYRVGINRASIGALIGQFASQYGVKESDITDITRALEEEPVRSLVDGVIGEVWISKKTNDIVKVAFPIDLTALTKGEGSITGSFTAQFSDWGKPVNVEAPADAKSVQELLVPLLGGALGGGFGGGLAPDPAGALDGTDAPAGAFPGAFGGDATDVFGLGEVDDDGDGLSYSQESRYGSDPNKADTDGDGFSDGDEVKKGYSPIGPGPLLPVTP